MPDLDSSRILHKSQTDCEHDNWQLELAKAQVSPLELLKQVNVAADQVSLDLDPSFKCVAPAPYVSRIEQGNPNDPLLLQVLPTNEENNIVDGFINDPLGEADSNPVPGLIHKYKNRALLITSTACAINCRYCFRRNFAYSDNRLGRSAMDTIKAYLLDHPELDEVILSGGDPLVINDRQLDLLLSHIESVPHIKRLRIHTRLPVVIPSRVNNALIARLAQSRLATVMVLHINHAKEIDDTIAQMTHRLKDANITLLNQSVLLKGINDSADTLRELSERLFDIGVLPYYLHMFDSVKGAHHFANTEQEALDIYRQLQTTTSGYLVPKLAKEHAGEQNKRLYS